MKIKLSNPIKWAVILVLWTIIAFVPALNNDLLQYDDAFYVTQNPLIHKFSWENIGKIFADEKIGIFPLAVVSFAVEYQIAGLDPWIYHVDNVILHVFNVLLVYVLLFQLSGKINIAFLTAIFFSISPLRVESVAWVSERKDVLYAFFYLSSLCVYVRMLQSGLEKKWHMLLGCILYCAALLAKPQAITLPLVILSLDVWVYQKSFKDALVRQWPYIVITVLFFFFWIQPHAHALSATDIRIADSVEKALLACSAALLYGIKTFIPYQLSPVYPFPPRSNGYFHWAIYAAPLFLMVIGFLSWAFMRRQRLVVFGALFFIFNILMPLRLIWHNWFFAEHYSYVPGIGLGVVFSVLIVALFEKFQQEYRKAGYVLVFIYMVVLSGMTYRYCHVWENDITLLTHAINAFPNDLRTSFSYWNRAGAYAHRGDDENALKDLNKAIAMYPDFAQAYTSRAWLYFRRQEYNKSWADIRELRRLGETVDKNLLLNLNALSQGAYSKE